MQGNPLLLVEKFGQSLWLDYISRHLLNSGDLRQLVAEDGLTGVTTNPTIFEKAIDQSDDYDEAIRNLALGNKNTAEIFESLVVADVQQAADILSPVSINFKEKMVLSASKSTPIWLGIRTAPSRKPTAFGKKWEDRISLLKCRPPRRVCRLFAG
jgi:Transaldolase/Fructose-6-phosphate aldolase